jgi:hypothetical protein
MGGEGTCGVGGKGWGVVLMRGNQGRGNVRGERERGSNESNPNKLSPYMYLGHAGGLTWYYLGLKLFCSGSFR